MLLHNPKPNHKHGFTLVEVLIIAPVVILVIGIFIGVMVSMTGDVIASRSKDTLAFDIQDALTRIRQDVRYSIGYLATNINSVTLTTPQGYNNDTTAFYNVSNSVPSIGQMLILKIYATSGNPITSPQNIVYLSNSPNPCNNIFVTSNTPLIMNIVYFVKKINGASSSSLWRRVLAPSPYVGCVNGSSGQSPWQRPSCVPGSVNAFCKADDIKLLDGVEVGDFAIVYADNTSSVTTIASATNTSLGDAARQTAIDSAGSISISITANQTIAGRNISQSGTIRAIHGK